MEKIRLENPAERRDIKIRWRAKVEAEMVLRNIDQAEFDRRIKVAMAWHNPNNWSDKGTGLKARHGFDMLFDDARAKEGLSRARYYFPFHKYDCTDWITVADQFEYCKNYDRYLEIWEKYAPQEINSEVFFMGCLVRMTVKGMTHEANEIKRLGLRESTPEEDLAGIDAWTADGRPVQIKSPATQAGM